MNLFGKILAATLFSVLVCVPFKQAHAEKTGNGGDACEDQMKHIRNNLEFWLTNGGPERGLRVPPGVTLDWYKRSMLRYISENIPFTNSPNPDKAVLSCTSDRIFVDGVEKTCRNYDSDPRTGTPSIQCNFQRFNQTDSNRQYFLMHHEYAGLAQLEPNNGPESLYIISDQITGYLRNEVVTQLAVVDPVHDRGSTSSCTIQNGPEVYLNGSDIENYDDIKPAIDALKQMENAGVCTVTPVQCTLQNGPEVYVNGSDIENYNDIGPAIAALQELEAAGICVVTPVPCTIKNGPEVYVADSDIENYSEIPDALAALRRLQDAGVCRR
jgi:hypothetical protein